MPTEEETAAAATNNASPRETAWRSREVATQIDSEGVLDDVHVFVASRSRRSTQMLSEDLAPGPHQGAELGATLFAQGSVWR
jgi:hypothetical protein